MKIKELIEKLKTFDEYLDVYANDQCGGGYPVTADCIKTHKGKTKDGKDVEFVEIG